jgi:hypothetical protein
MAQMLWQRYVASINSRFVYSHVLQCTCNPDLGLSNVTSCDFLLRSWCVAMPSFLRTTGTHLQSRAHATQPWAWCWLAMI